MHIKLNGEQRELPGGLTVEQLLGQENYRPERVAVEVNLAIVPKRDYVTHVLQDGDTVEVVSFVGGG